jgi:integrase
MIMLGIHRLIPEPKPRAQWVPANCVTRAAEWIDGSALGDRLVCDIAALQILLGSSAPFRPTELQRLRLRNVSFLADGKQVEVEIVALPGTDGLKTEAGTRRVMINDTKVAMRLLRWCEARRNQGAPESGFVFADANDDSKLYRPYAVRAAILRVLKAATGDPSMTVYALRHSWISREMEHLLMTDSIVDFNRLMHLADAAGHVSPATSIYFYSHQYEIALRSFMTSILSEDVRLTGPDAESLL